MAFNTWVKHLLNLRFRKRSIATSNTLTLTNRLQSKLIVASMLGISALLTGCSGGGDSADSSPSATGTSATGAVRVFNSPVDLVEVSSSNKATIDVSWLPASDGITAASAVDYQVHASTAATFTPNASTLKFQGKGVLSTQLTGLLAATRYTVMLVATTSSGYKSISDPLQVTTSSLTTTLVSSAKVITPTTSQIVTVSPYQMTLPSTVATPKAGEFIATTKNNGILRRVTSVTTTASGTTVQTQPASLNEVVSVVNFSSAFKLKAVPATTTTAKLAKGTTLFRSASGTSKMQWEQTGFSLESTPSSFTS